MLRIFTTQLLPLLLALLGAMLGVALSVLVPPTSRLWTIGVSVLSGLIVMGVVYLIIDAISLEHRVKVVGEKIRFEIDQASGIEYKFRQAGDAAVQEQKPFPLTPFVNAIEEWRDRVDGMLRQELPESGADIRFRTGGGAIGAGPATWEYSRLTVLRANLLHVLDNLPSYVQRSH